MMKKSLLLAGAAVLALSSAATAATFGVTGLPDDSIPDAGQTNEVLTNVFGLASLRGSFGSTISIDMDATINVNYLGYEAGFFNSFSITGDGSSGSFDTDDFFGVANNGSSVNDGGSMYALDHATPIDSFSIDVLAGDLDFSFATTGNGGKSAVNGSNPDNGLEPDKANFFTSFSADMKTVFLFFDDTGAGDDDNHDDFVVSLSIGPPSQEPNPVPLPAGGLLLIGGLGAFAMARRRKTKA